MPWSISTWTKAFIRGKVKLYDMKNEEKTNYAGFLLHIIFQEF